MKKYYPLRRAMAKGECKKVGVKISKLNVRKTGSEWMVDGQGLYVEVEGCHCASCAICEGIQELRKKGKWPK